MLDTKERQESKTSTEYSPIASNTVHSWMRIERIFSLLRSFTCKKKQTKKTTITT